MASALTRRTRKLAVPSLRFPSEKNASQQEVLRRVADAEQHGLVAHIRVLVALVDDEWLPICGRIDVARTEDAPTYPVRPKASVRLLTETISVSALAERLKAAFQEQPFVVHGESIVGHGMGTSWGGEHHHEDWSLYSARWPVFTFCPTQGVARPVTNWEPIEAEGKAEAIDGTEDCVRLTMGYIERTRGYGDVRFNKFYVVVWDYRGVIRTRTKRGMLHIEVLPKKDPALTLAIIIGDDKGRRSRKKTAPTRLRVPIAGTFRRMNMSLRRGTETVCHSFWDRGQEEAFQRLDGRLVRSPSAPEVVETEAEPVSTTAELVLGFMSDAKLAAMVVKDLDEMDATFKVRAYKAAVLLIGSILETALLDVAKRNEPEALRRLGSKWPDRASLKDLIGLVSNIRVATSAGSAPLLPPLTSTKGLVVVEHRDIIHPRAQVRGDAKIDEHVATTMRGVLGEVIRDLQQAHKDGLLDAYATGKVV